MTTTPWRRSIAATAAGSQALMVVLALIVLAVAITGQ